MVKINRKEALKGIAVGAASLTLSPNLMAGRSPQPTNKLKGNINHSVCKWCYNSIPLEDMCIAAKKIGLQSIEIIGPSDWPTVLKHDLTCAMGTVASVPLTQGFNDPSLHEQLKKDYLENLPIAADAGLKRIICFSGNRNGMDDDTGLENCARGLEPIVKEAEKRNIIIAMELLNSKVNHPDYQCDLTPWGVKLVDKVGSDNFKLLYDIYHMQIMEGDIIATIRDYNEYITHYHTGGVPGRNEIDETQELYYPAIMKAILDTGYDGYVGQEFVPTWEDPLAALKQGVEICDV